MTWLLAVLARKYAVSETSALADYVRKSEPRYAKILTKTNTGVRAYVN